MHIHIYIYIHDRQILTSKICLLCIYIHVCRKNCQFFLLILSVVFRIRRMKRMKFQSKGAVPEKLFPHHLVNLAIKINLLQKYV